jgi:hypothetical protein
MNPTQKSHCYGPVSWDRAIRLSHEISRGIELAVQHRCALERIEGERTIAYRHQPRGRHPTVRVHRDNCADPAPLWAGPRQYSTGLQPLTRIPGTGYQNQQASEANCPPHGQAAATRKKGLTKHPNLLYKFPYDREIETQRQIAPLKPATLAHRQRRVLATPTAGK